MTLSSAEPYILVTTEVEPPSTLHAEPYASGENELTRLAWAAATGAAQYNVYAVAAAEPFFTKKATVAGTATSFDTTIPWCGTVCTEPTTFVVTSVTEAGVESFYPTPTQNDDRDGDGLDDRGETMLGTDTNNPDTDGDELDDLTESNLGTNLLNADTDGDGYSDKVEMDRGSDPRDAADIPPCLGDLDRDGDIDGLDLSMLVSGNSKITVDVFAQNFGETECRP